MEQPMRCKTLTAIYKNEINTLKKLYEIDFLIHKSVRIHIEQFTVRKIEIDFTSEQLVDDLIAVLTKVERLLMLFDGYFMNLISIEFQDSAGCVPPNLKECAEHFMRRRLAYFHSNKILFSSNYLLDFSKVLTPALYEKWKGILEDLDVAHQVYLYSLCDTNQPVDLRCAFLIELAEPVVEIVKANSPLFESLNPGKQGTSLRDCLRALITTYGSDIFENEINSCFETFLKSLVNSRVRIIRGFSGGILSFDVRPVQLIDAHHKLMRADLLDYLTSFPVFIVGSPSPLRLGYDLLVTFWAAQNIVVFGPFYYRKLLAIGAVHLCFDSAVIVVIEQIVRHYVLICPALQVGGRLWHTAHFVQNYSIPLVAADFCLLVTNILLVPIQFPQNFRGITFCSDIPGNRMASSLFIKHAGLQKISHVIVC